MIYMDNWSFGFQHCGDPYQPPEVGHQVLQGEVNGHPDFPDGTQIHTSRAIRTEVWENNELVVITKSGTEYHLKEKSAEYKEWLAQQIEENREKHNGNKEHT
tara:strand:- start:68 stop:373 length:306 start_codon:yes stop_codon:yes gene_type:complete